MNATTTATAKVIPTDIARQIAHRIYEEGEAPMATARIFGLLVHAGYTHQEIGELADVHPGLVEHRLRLLDLPSGAQDAVECGALTPDGAISFYL